MADPIIIIGAGRSGTKFLRDVLASGSGTACIPYDVNYVWRFGASFDAHDALPDDPTPRQTRFIQKTLRRLAGMSGDNGKVLIEKTVSNTLRVPLVAKVEPQARFVHLIRDGRDVTESAIRQWQAPPDPKALWRKLSEIPLANAGYVFWFAVNFLKGLISGRGGGRVWGPRYPGISEDLEKLPLPGICARQWAVCVDAARRDLAKLPTDRVHELHYEDLVTDEGALARLVDSLGLPDRAQILDNWRNGVRAQMGTWRRMTDGDQQIMMDQLGPTLDALGYGDGR